MNGKSLFWLILLPCLWIACKDSPPVQEQGDYVYQGEQVYYKGDKNANVVSHLLSDPKNLHPFNSRVRYRDLILEYTHQRLISINTKTGKVSPLLATQLPVLSEDGLTYTFDLDPTASWPDGTAITAADILISTKAAACPLTDNGYQKVYMQYLSDVRLDEEDPNRLYFDFSEYYMNNGIFGALFFILDKRVIDPEGILNNYSVQQFLEDGESLKDDPKLIEWAKRFNDDSFGRDIALLNNGSGPYEFSEWVAEQRIVLTRRDNYWGQGRETYFHKQYPEKIIFKVLKDNTAIELQVKQAELDVAELSYESLINLKQSEIATQNFHLREASRPSFAFIALNARPDGINHSPFFVDKGVRQAMTYALPIDEMLVEYLQLDPKETRVVSPVAQSNPDCNQNITPLPYDQAKAMALLDDAGWKDSDGDLIRDKMIEGQKVDFIFELTYVPNSQALTDIVGRVAEELAQVGIKCEPKEIALEVLRQSIFSHQFDACLMALSSSNLPYDFNQIFYSEDWAEGGNFMGFANEEADSLMNQARVERDQAKRKEIVDRIQEIIYDEQPCVFLYSPTKKLAIHKRFNNSEIYSTPNHIILNEFQMIPWGEKK